MKRLLLALALASLPVSVARDAQAAPTITNAALTDVTPFGFATVWEVSELSTPGIAIFSDAAGMTDVTSQFEITAYPLRGGDPTAVDEAASEAAAQALRDAVAAKGLAKVAAKGGTPGTPYYVRVRSEAAGETSEFPAGAPLAVTLPDANTFLARSQQLLVSFTGPDPTGWIVTATSPDGLYPVSAVVGDGAAADQAFLNLGQLFDLSGANWEPVGPTPVTFMVRQGPGAAPAPSFDVVFQDGFAVATAYRVDFTDPAEPLVVLVDPDRGLYSDGEPIPIGWEDALPGVGGQVALYYDTDNSGRDGTLIASGLPEAADGTDDAFAWDTTGIPDGIYFLYAQVSNGVVEDTAYASTRVVIDRAGTDGDGDLIADLWEELFLGGPATSDGTSDGDGDGAREREEFLKRTNPGIPDVRLTLRPGLNLIALPITPSPLLVSADLLPLLGATEASLSRVEAVTQSTQTTDLVGGVAQGDLFPISPGEGYELQLDTDFDGVLSGLVAGGAADLAPGVNPRGFVSVPDNYSAYQLLADLGGSGVVASVARFDPASGRFETASYAGGQSVGVDFPVERGVGYLIHLLQPVSGFAP